MLGIFRDFADREQVYHYKGLPILQPEQEERQNRRKAINKVPLKDSRCHSAGNIVKEASVFKVFQVGPGLDGQKDRSRTPSGSFKTV